MHDKKNTIRCLLNKIPVNLCPTAFVLSRFSAAAKPRSARIKHRSYWFRSGGGTSFLGAGATGCSVLGFVF